MKSKKCIIIIISIVVCLILAFIVYYSIPKKENINIETVIVSGDIKINVNPTLNEEKQFNSLKFDNIKLIEKEGKSTITADVQNVSQNAIDDYTKFEIIMLDENGGTIGTIPGIIGPIKAGEVRKLNARITEDYVNAHDFRIEFK